jgi:hypothetical protein
MMLGGREVQRYSGATCRRNAGVGSACGQGPRANRLRRSGRDPRPPSNRTRNQWRPFSSGAVRRSSRRTAYARSLARRPQTCRGVSGSASGSDGHDPPSRCGQRLGQALRLHVCAGVVFPGRGAVAPTTQQMLEGRKKHAGTPVDLDVANRCATLRWWNAVGAIGWSGPRQCVAPGCGTPTRAWRNVSRCARRPPNGPTTTRTEAARQLSADRLMRPSDRGRYLSASEIGSFVYCPEAWYLERHGIPPDAGTMERLRAGSVAHRRIGHATDRLVGLDKLRRGLLVVLIVVALVILTHVSGIDLAHIPR